MKSILINSLILSFGILLGRLSGYIRELLIAYKYQITENADNILLLLTIPDLLNNLLSSGAVAGILIPLLSENKRYDIVLSSFIVKLFKLALFSYLVVLCIIFYLYEMYLFSLLSISLISIFPNIITFVVSTYLQYEKRFKIISLNTLIFNSGIIIFILFDSSLLFLSFGIIVASIARMLWTNYDLKFTPTSIKDFFVNKPGSIVSFKTLVVVIISNGLLYINPIIDKVFASFMKEGSVAMLSYAEKIYMLPVSLFLTTYAVAMFPNLVELITKKDYTKAIGLLNKSIVLNLLISLAVSIGLFLFSFEVTNLVYYVANMNEKIINEIMKVLDGYIISLFFAGSNAILLQVVFTFKKYNLIVFYSVSMLLCNLLLDLIVYKLNFNLEYIAYVTSFVSFLSFIYLFIYAKKLLKEC